MERLRRNILAGLGRRILRAVDHLIDRVLLAKTIYDARER
jgi:uncharacterized membrane protein